MKQKKDGNDNSKPRSKPEVAGGLGLLPPPPSGKLPAPPGSSPAGSPSHAPKTETATGDSWGEFASAQTRLVIFLSKTFIHNTC